MRIQNTAFLGGAIAVALTAGGASGQTIRSGSAIDAAGLTDLVNLYRADLGVLNPNTVGTFGSGRREINWDGVPDASSSPNVFPEDFFNLPVAGRARGTEFTTPGTHLEVSASLASGQSVRFGTVNSAYTDMFATFSQQRLFTGIGSNIVDVEFFIPGFNVRATTTGFGVVFTDVDLGNSTSIEYFDVNGDSLGLHFVEAGPAANGSLSFFGLSYVDAIIASVRITSGTEALGGLEGEFTDLVVMDDFIYGEPVPTPGTIGLMSVAGLVAIRRRR